MLEWHIAPLHATVMTTWKGGIELSGCCGKGLHTPPQPWNSGMVGEK
jgi:hypothetical protein